jgi:hypothetical protein
MDRRLFLAGSLAGCASCVLPPQTRPTPELAQIEAAFAFAFPLFEFARTAWEAAGISGERLVPRYNQLVHRRVLSDHTSRAVTAVNNDALLSYARIDLSGGPLVLDSPSIHDRYFGVAFMDAFTDNFALFGTRASKGEGGRFLIVPPGWSGKTPPGMNKIEAPTTDVWMLIRILVTGADDIAAVNVVQDKFRLAPLAPAEPPTFIDVRPSDVKDPENFLAVANAMLGRSPSSDVRVGRSLQYAHLGLSRGETQAWSRLSGRVRGEWRELIPGALDRLAAAGKAQQRFVEGWSYTAASNGRFGDNDYLRAVVALYGLAALPAEEALYALASADGSGAMLEGTNSYRLRLPPGGPPVGAFWSVTCYQVEPDGRLFLSENPIQRYSIGDRSTGLLKNSDGSLDVLIQREPPKVAARANWLPTPFGRFTLAFRFYIPTPQLLALQWRLPPIERVAGEEGPATL